MNRELGDLFDRCLRQREQCRHVRLACETVGDALAVDANPCRGKLDAAILERYIRDSRRPQVQGSTGTRPFLKSCTPAIAHVWGHRGGVAPQRRLGGSTEMIGAAGLARAARCRGLVLRQSRRRGKASLDVILISLMSDWHAAMRGGLSTSGRQYISAWTAHSRASRALR